MLSASVAFFLLLSSLTCEPHKVVAELKAIHWLTEDYPPYNYRDQHGRLMGVSTELLIGAYQSLGVALEPEAIKVVPWARLYKKVQQTPGWGGYSMMYTQDRAHLFSLVRLPYNTNISLMTLSQTPDYLKLDDYTVAVVREDIGKHLLDSLQIRALQVETSSAQDMLTALIRGRVNAIAYEEAVARFQFSTMGWEEASIRVVKKLGEAPSTLALNKAVSPCAVAALQQAMTQQGFDHIWRKYIK